VNSQLPIDNEDKDDIEPSIISLDSCIFWAGLKRFFPVAGMAYEIPRNASRGCGNPSSIWIPRISPWGSLTVGLVFDTMVIEIWSPSSLSFLALN
jgi:hypothetical protein